MHPSSTHLVPTSSRPRPPAGDDLRNRPRPSSPSPSGDEVELASTDDHTTTTSTSSPGRGQNATPNSGLFVHPTDCDYCHAWPAFPCALHRSDR